MSRLPGWNKWATRPWYAFALVAVLVIIIVTPGHTLSGTFVGAGFFLLLVAGAAGWAASSLDRRQFYTIQEQVSNEHHPIVRSEETKYSHPEQNQAPYWVWHAKCPCVMGWSYSGTNEAEVREAARQHEQANYRTVKVPRHNPPPS